MTAAEMYAPMTETAGSAAMFFGFAAELYLEEPDEKLLHKSRLFGETLTDIFPDNPVFRLFRQAGDETPDALKQEFYDLFLVPASGVYSRPYESVWREGSLNGKALNEAAELFTAAGFAWSSQSAFPPIRAIGRADYIGYELSFIAQLFAKAAEEKNLDEAENLYFTAINFYHLHLEPWLNDYGKQMEASACTSFFKACGVLTVFLAEGVKPTLLTEMRRVQA